MSRRPYHAGWTDEAFMFLVEAKSLRLSSASTTSTHGRQRDGSTTTTMTIARRARLVSVGRGPSLPPARRPDERCFAVTFGDVRVRNWTPQDRDDAAETVAEVLAEYGLGWEPHGADRDVIEVESSYWARGGEFWIIESRLDGGDVGKIVGTAAFQPREDLAGCVEVRKMYLRKAWRGRGLGRFPLDALEFRIQQLQFQSILIETASCLVEAVQMYRNSGYVPPENGKVETERCDIVLMKTIESMRESRDQDVIERTDIVDERGFLVLENVPRRFARDQGSTHRGVGVLVVNQDGKVFVHQRASSKKPYPNHFDMFVGGVARSGEPSARAAGREVHEELGLTGLQLEYVADCLCDTPENRCFVSVFIARGHFDDGSVVLQEEEVCGGSLMTRRELEQHLGKEKYVVDGIQVWNLCRPLLEEDSFSLREG